MTRTKHVQGMLAPTKFEAVTENTREIILEAANRHGLGLVITECAVDGILTMNSLTPASGGSSSVYDMLAPLDSFLYAEGVKELGLEGSLTVSVITATDSVVIPMTIRSNAQVDYERPHSHWRAKVAPQLVEDVTLMDVAVEQIKAGTEISV